ncbi:MAG: class II aldolase/adducin family protein [Streptobacillus sp.]|jgi:class II aldolase/adducin family protein
MNVKEMIVEAGRKMYNTGLVAGTSGNISMRNPDKEDSFFITPSSMAYDQIQEHDIVEINSKGEPYIKGLRPSSEWQMHVCVYERFKKYNAIVHTHSTFATSFAVTHEDIPLILIEMRPYLGGDLHVAPYRPAGSKELGEVILPYLEDRNSCLLANHGTISCGETLEDAFMAAEYVEDAAKIYYYAKTSGTPVIIK